MTVLGIILSTRSKPEENKAHFSNHYHQGSLLEVKILEKLKKNDFYTSYLGEVIGVDRSRTEGKILIRTANKDSLPALAFDEKLITSQELLRFKEPMNPGAFNFREYAERKGIYFQLTLDKGKFVRTENDQLSIRSKALIMRDKILTSLLEQDFATEEFMIIEALLLGSKKDLSKDIAEKYKNAGAMHILAISGLHIGILLMMINMILKPIESVKHGKSIKLFLLLLSLWFFAFLSGLSPSVIRAVLMFSILSIGIVVGRFSKIDHYLFVSLFLSLLIEPLLIFDLGFQLSYAAVLSIIGISPIIKNLWKPRHKMLRYFWNLFVVSFAAQLGILPLSLFYFHHFSGAFILSSLIIIPLLSLVLGGGYFMIFLDQVNSLPKTYVEIYSKLIDTMNRVIGFISEMEFLIYSNIYFNIFLVFLCYIAIYYLVNFIKVSSIESLVKLCFCCMITTSFLLVDFKLGQSESNFIVFNQYKESLILRRSGHSSIAYSNTAQETVQIQRSIEAYRMQHLNLSCKKIVGMNHFYNIKNKHIMLIDNEWIDTDFGFKPDILILTQSPKINLSRLIMKFQPAMIIADGSNYKSYKSLWGKTAKEAAVLFHDTSKDGAFILSEES